MSIQPRSFDETPLQNIPWIDMSHFLHGSFSEKMAVAKKFGEAFQKLGFVAVTNIGIRAQTIDRAYAIAEKYFNLPEEIKLQQESKDGHRGFIPFGKEHAKYTEVMDLKEFYQTTGPTQPQSLWPTLPGFTEAMMALYLELEQCVKLCLQATAIYLGYEKETTILSDLLGSGLSVMRILHYPPIEPRHSLPGAIRSAPHEDLCMMTIIPRATRPGLQVKNHQGEWLNVSVPEGAAIINSGDTLSYITNGIIPSTTHQVINPEFDDCSHRYSIPFFGSPPADTILKVLDQCKSATVTNENSKEMTFGEFMAKRFREIGIAPPA